MSRLGNVGGRLYRGEVSFDFVGRQKLWYSISGLILVLSLVGLFARGLNFSVDFKGGSVIQFPATSATSLMQVQNAVSDTGDGEGAIVQHVGSGNSATWQVQTGKLNYSQGQEVQSTLSRELSVPQSEISVNFVGASWGGQISQKALQALIAFLIVIVIYLSIAFEWRMAVAALIALAHDIVITIGIYALAGFQVAPASVIGLLTILGYSLYDTVVVFDKVRENTAGLLGSARSTYSQAANLALNQTLVRSINTSIIALLPVAAILFIGGGLLGAGELNDLALVLFVGMLSGTYSSIFIATPVLADLKERDPQYKALAKRVAQRASGSRAARRASAKASRPTVAGAGAAAAGAAVAGSATVLDDDTDVADADVPDADVPGQDADAGDAGPARTGCPRRGRRARLPGAVPARGSSPAGPLPPSAAPAARRSGARWCEPVASGTDIAELIKSRIRDIADYPQPGVMFKDITPLLADGAAFAAVVSALASGYDGVDKVAGIEARGFILAAPVAIQLGAGFVPVRKQGKLPGPTYAQSYDLEYGSATVEVHQDAFAPGERVLIVDDVLATGGTGSATAELVRKAGAEVAAIAVIMELSFLNGRSRLPDAAIRSLLVV